MFANPSAPLAPLHSLHSLRSLAHLAPLLLAVLTPSPLVPRTGALYNLSFSTGRNPNGNCARVHELGGVVTTMEAVGQFGDHTRLQQFALGVLSNLAFGDGVGAHVRREDIINAGGIALVLASMQRLESDEWVQKEGCAAIMHIAASDGAFDAVAEDAIKAIARAMGGFPDSVVLQKCAAYALAVLVFDIPPRMALALEAGVGPLLAHAADIGSHAAVSQLQRMGVPYVAWREQQP